MSYLTLQYSLATPGIDHGTLRLVALKPAVTLTGAQSPTQSRVHARVPSKNLSHARGSARDKGLRLTKRGRLIITLLVLTFLVPLVSAAASTDNSPQAQEVLVHVVAPGETLWEIAQGNKAPDDGIWEAVSKIKRLNRLETSALHVGQTILLPSG